MNPSAIQILFVTTLLRISTTVKLKQPTKDELSDWAKWSLPIGRNGLGTHQDQYGKASVWVKFYTCRTPTFGGEGGGPEKVSKSLTFFNFRVRLIEFAGQFLWLILSIDISFDITLFNWLASYTKWIKTVYEKERKQHKVFF